VLQLPNRRTAFSIQHWEGRFCTECWMLESEEKSFGAKDLNAKAQSREGAR
jgi:hypothetical protein